jgi:uncharacterized protein
MRHSQQAQDHYEAQAADLGRTENERGLAAQAAGDPVGARKAHLRGAQLGNDRAQFNYGTMCILGDGGPRDFVQAAKWLRLAAKQGHREAQCNLASLYHFGRGVPEDDAEALRWLLRACAQGDGFAQYNAAAMYEAGEGTSVDLVEAYKWCTLAAERGMPLAPAKCEALEFRMTDEEVRKALELASDFRPCPE